MIYADWQRQAGRKKLIVAYRFGKEPTKIKTTFVQRRRVLISSILRGVTLLVESDAGDMWLSVTIPHLIIWIHLHMVAPKPACTVSWHSDWSHVYGWPDTRVTLMSKQAWIIDLFIAINKQGSAQPVQYHLLFQLRGILWHGDICKLQFICRILWRHNVNHHKLLFLNEQVWRAIRLDSITKNFCITRTVKHNYILPISTVRIQLHVSALYVGHLQVEIFNLQISYTGCVGRLGGWPGGDEISLFQ